LEALAVAPAEQANSKDSFFSKFFVPGKRETFLIIPFLLLIIGLKLVVSLYLWRTGYIEHDPDGFTRSVRAWQWRSGLVKLEVDAWLPLQFWLNGWLMNFFPDLLRVPRVVNTLCATFTTINLFFIGRLLFGRWTGYLAGLLAAIFPWEIWFGLSGMSESLTHFFLSFGIVFFVYWLQNEIASRWWLVLASVGFLGATMLRYEAWFYAAVYAVVVFFVTWRRQSFFTLKLLLRTALALAPAFIFILIWMAASWLDPRLNSPLGFARLTSEINEKIYGEANINANLLSRFLFYPQIFLNLLWTLSLPAIFGSVWLALKPLKSIRPYLALVWGEFALFILTTLPYNNIAPGSARYPVSNLLLLLPVVAFLIVKLFEQKQLLVRLAGGLAALVILGSMFYTTITRQPYFPDNSTRQVAEWLKNQWDTGLLWQDEKVLLHLPAADGPQVNEFIRAYYSILVLTNHPDNFETTADFAQFKERAMITNFSAPSAWVQMKSAGGDTFGFDTHFREIKDFGDYVGGRLSAFRRALVSPVQGGVNQSFGFTADQFGSKETTIGWVTSPSGKVFNMGNKDADEKGNVRQNYNFKDAEPGEWAVTIVGMQTGRRAIALFTITPGR
jgi:hypothetical protein